MIKKLWRLGVAVVVASSLGVVSLSPALAQPGRGGGPGGGPGGGRGGGPGGGGFRGGPGGGPGGGFRGDRGFRGGGWGGGGYYHGYRGGWGPGAAFGMGALGVMTGALIANGAYGYGGYGYYGGCGTRMQWDPYIGDYVPMRFCY
ncbi:hypothetical protein ZMO02_08410 [Zymomonas mobilis subsp. pomaceae]|uniref:Uncharacterized protein n=2 Tax=Zymomonas mobilis TaxID=542 RepID=F8ETZ8_ZYMMT|nr:hypothetical protein Zymop_1200 [Zymomonas mobilis subsp. pomaceae ATCC 29192]GEB89204.1 hypothetical protein ZMO02_08410 [Zymomonas mobilis subsp. pomaceae]